MNSIPLPKATIHKDPRAQFLVDPDLDSSQQCRIPDLFIWKEPEKFEKEKFSDSMLDWNIV